MLIFSMFEDDPDCFWIISQSVLHVPLYCCPWGGIPVLVSLDPAHEPPFVEGTWLSLLRSCVLAHGREERNASALVVLREPQFGTILFFLSSNSFFSCLRNRHFFRHSPLFRMMSKLKSNSLTDPMIPQITHTTTSSPPPSIKSRQNSRT